MNVINVNGGKVHNGTEYRDGTVAANCMSHNPLRTAMRRYAKTDAPVTCKKCVAPSAPKAAPVAMPAAPLTKVTAETAETGLVIDVKGAALEILAMNEIGVTGLRTIYVVPADSDIVEPVAVTLFPGLSYRIVR